MRTLVTSDFWNGLRVVRGSVGVLIGALLACVLVAPTALAADIGYVSAGSFGAGPGAGDGELNAPKRVAVRDSDGAVFVVDADNDRVQVFDAGGTFVSQFGAGELDDPFGIAIDQATGEVYVSSAGNERIVKYDGTLTLDPAFVSPGKGAAAGRLGDFRAPLAFDQASDRLLVGDPGKDIVQRYTPAGAFVNDLDGATAPGGGFTDVKDIASAPNGDVLVVDAARVERFDAAGAHLATLAPAPAPAPGQVAVDPNTGNVLVTINTDPFSDSRLAVFTGAGARSSDLSLDTQGGVPTGIAVRAGGDGRVHVGSDWSFSCCGRIGVLAFLPQELPDPAVAPATGVTVTAATLHGSVDPNGNAANWRFELSVDGGQSWTPVDPDGDGDEGPVNGDGAQPVSQDATGLQPGTEYRVRLTATAVGGGVTVSASTESFTTHAAVAPAVTFEPPVVAGDTATLTGTVDPQGVSTSYYFEYSTDGGGEWIPHPGSFVPFCELGPGGCSPPECFEADGCWYPEPVDAGAGTDPVAVEVTLPLDPAVTYQVRLRATNAGGTTTSAAESFDMAGEAPVAITATIGNRLHDETWVAGFVNPRNQPTSYWFEWGITTDYGNSTPAAHDGDAGDGTIARPVGQRLTGLQPQTTYHYRLVAQNATATVHGDDRSFTTRPAPAPRGAGVGADGDRTNELVSHPDKESSVIQASISEDGDRVLYQARGGLPGSSYGHAGTLLARRTPAGWKPENPMPPAAALGDPLGYVWAASRDLSRFILRTNASIGDTTAGQTSTYWRYVPDTEQLTRGATVVAHNVEGVQSAGDVASDDMRHTLTFANLAPAPVDTTKGGLYDMLVGPQPATLGLLPTGSPPACGISYRDIPMLAGPMSRTRGWVTDDGQRAFFHSREADCSSRSELYVREGGADGSTSLVSGPPVSGPSRGARFQQAARDGSWVFFTTGTRLEARDTDDTPDLYRRVLGGGNECVTCVVPNADVVAGEPFPTEAKDTVVVAADGSRAYFISRRALAPGGVSGSENLYVWRDGSPDEIRFVAPVSGLVTTGGGMTAMPTPDGAVLMFQASPAALDTLSGSDRQGTPVQWYRYDDRDRSLACVSCPAGRPATRAVPIDGVSSVPESVTPDQLSDDGRSLVFTTAEALVGADVNGTDDVYEWRDGRAGLITDGRSQLASRRIGVAAVSGDGRTVLFLWQGTPLAPGDRNPGTTSVYAARTGGGFPEAGVRSPCVGDGCQGGGSPAPSFPEAASIGFSGEGDAHAPSGRRPVEKVVVPTRAVKGQRFAIRVRVPGRGSIRASGASIQTVRVKVSRAGTRSLKLSLKSNARKALRQQRRMRVRVRVAYSPRSGPSSAITVSLTVKA